MIWKTVILLIGMKMSEGHAATADREGKYIFSESIRIDFQLYDVNIKDHISSQQWI
jgi:hypothetical protein